MVADQAQAGRCGKAGLAPSDEKRAGRLFKRLDALADRRWRDMQVTRGKVEGPATMDSGKGGKLGGIKH